MKQLRLSLFLLLMVAFLGMAGRVSAGELDEIYRLTDEKKLDQAMKKLENFLREHPKDAEARFLQGLIFTGKSQNDEAIRVFRELGADYPDLPEPFNNLAVLYAERGDYENARQALLNAVRILPDYATAHENLGDVYAKLASQAYAQALRINNSNAMVSAKLDFLKKLFVAAGTAPADSGSPIVAAKAPAKAVPERADNKKTAAVVPPPAPTSVSNVGDAEARSELDPASRALTTSSNEPAPAAPAVAESAPVPSASAEIERTVQAWAKVWSAKKVDEYLSFYSDSAYTPPDKFADREAWKQQRRVALSASGTIRVTLSNIKVNVTAPDRAQVTFNQSYWSNRYQDQVQKTLAMQKEGAAWKIVREF
ncbi:nuclear transport factor 2 family protein [Candidatus Magnetaquicoccus inordinatus]|uniref:nuclear transport factor 2 family protein n=1 Tax=Candidatus Magnetaquicoccus inordinatus TaxID=2496818 RepID=UPI00187D1ED7|nr:nuclear transport factor 2 family protein [Candidatus Magnetaquicoccus inordinatus]